MGVNTGNEDSLMLKTDTIQITPELLALIAEVDEFKGAWPKRWSLKKLIMATLPELAAQIIDGTRKRGRITIGDMIRATGASRNRLKEHFKRLLEQGHLVRHGTGKAT